MNTSVNAASVAADPDAPDLTTWSLDQLETERQRIVKSAPTADDLSLSKLRLLMDICNQLRVRRRVASKPAGKSTKAPKATIDDFDFS